MKFTKILAAAAASVMMFSMTACSQGGGANGSSTTSPSDNTRPSYYTRPSDNTSSQGDSSNGSSTIVESSPSLGNKVFNVGICQLLEHDALDKATEGFKKGLIDKLGEDHVKFDFQSANNEVTNCTTITTNFVAANVDLIMANATPALMAAASATDTIPIVGTSITSYDVAFEYSDWTGKNITGASDLAPLDEQADMIKTVFPNAKKVGILYCSSEPNSVYQAEQIGKYLKEDGIECKEFTVADSNEIQAQTQAAVGECDLIYIPTDNTFAAAAETIKNVALPAKIPVVAAEEGICKGCGTVTLTISYYDMGYKAGEMAAEILANGKKAGDLEVGYSPVSKKYNKEICEELNVTVPEGYTAIKD